MKCTIPEISWHNRDPVLSVDFQPLTNEDFYRLASGGTDSHVLIWHLKICETGATFVEPVSDLTRHQRAVNVVRWSPSGQYLASGDDDSNIIIWHQKADDLAIMLDGDNNDKEKWSVFKVLRGHKEDVYDICWSPDSTKLLSGSVDNTAIIWDLAKGLNDAILTDHKGFVQGVTWDPLGQYLATLSSDRTFRIFTDNGKQVKARIYKGNLPVPESHALHGQVVRYYHDDTLKSFFRRLTFSPDGNLIITPAGFFESNNKKLYASYIFSITSLNQPVAILPSPGQYTIAVKCCPILFQLRENGPDPIISLPYRMIIAVATRSSVILYDTQQLTPFAIISNIHYTRLTDITWSSDGRLLIVSSTDGFCSLVTFEPEELGTEYIKETVEEEVTEELNDTVEEAMDTSLNVSIEDKKEKKPSFLLQWTKKLKIENGESTTNKMEVDIPETEQEKENKNKANLIIEEELKSPPASPKTSKSPAPKPIAVRRKPRNDQMNITQFLKSPQSTSGLKPNKSLIKSPININPDDSLTREPWLNEEKTCSIKNVEEEKNDEEDTKSQTPEIIIVEDNSQDMKLVLEDSLSDVTENDTNNTETNSTKILDECEIVTNFKPENSSNSTESKCDKNMSELDKTVTKQIPEVDDKKTANAKVLPPSVTKKRVPLITLSSPKHKKKHF